MVEFCLFSAAMFLLCTSPLGCAVIRVYCCDYDECPPRPADATGLTWDEYMTILRSAPRG